MSTKHPRRHFTTEQKAEILRRHRVDKVPVSDLCVFYQWQRQVHDNLPGALTTPASAGPSRREKELTAKVAQLEARLAKKDGVIAEIAEEYTQLKKERGEP